MGILRYEARTHILYVLVGATGSLILQLLCIQYSKYLKKHPELLSKFSKRNTDNTDIPNKLNTTNKKPGNRIISLVKEINFRSGAFLPAIPVILQFLTESGIFVGIVSGGFTYLVKLRKNNLIKIVYSCSPQNLPVTSLVSTESALLAFKGLEWVSDNNLRFLSNTLRDKSIPFEERKKTASRILLKHVNLTTDIERVKFVLSMIAMLLGLYIVNHGSFLILRNQLFEAVRAGKISKTV